MKQECQIQRGNLFFLIFLGTILALRITLYLAGLLSPNPDAIGLTIWRIRIHHYLFGLIIIFLGLIFHHLIIFAIGTALFIDELPYLLLGGTTHADNYSFFSLAGVVLLVIVVFFLRNKIVSLIEHRRKHAPL